VIIYSSNGTPAFPSSAIHVRHHKFTDWVDANKKDWKLLQYIKNKYPYDGTENTSFADFYFYERS
jgi:hypothetical protein